MDQRWGKKTTTPEYWRPWEVVQAIFFILWDINVVEWCQDVIPQYSVELHVAHAHLYTVAKSNDI